MASISDRTHDRQRGGAARDRGAPLTARTLLLFAGMVVTGAVALGLVTSAIASLLVPENQIGLRPYLVSWMPAVLMLFLSIIPALWCYWFWHRIFPPAERPKRRPLHRRRAKKAGAPAARAVVPKAEPRPVPQPRDPSVTERATADLLKRREERRERSERRRLEEERRRAVEQRRAGRRRLAEARRRTEEAPVAPGPAHGVAAGSAAPKTATPLAELRLSKRVHTTLSRAGIETIEQLTARTQADVLELAGVGAKSLEDILGALDRAGRALRYPQRRSRVS